MFLFIQTNEYNSILVIWIPRLFLFYVPFLKIYTGTKRSDTSCLDYMLYYSWEFLKAHRRLMNVCTALKIEIAFNENRIPFLALKDFIPWRLYLCNTNHSSTKSLLCPESHIAHTLYDTWIPLSIIHLK